MEQKAASVLFVDGIHSVGVHNGVSRVQFFKLDSEGEARVTVELLIPAEQISSVIDGLAQLTPKQEVDQPESD